jgi:hypothetical protein
MAKIVISFRAFGVLPESAEVYAMRYAEAGAGQLGNVTVLGLKLLHEDGDSKKVVALTAHEIRSPEPQSAC